MGALLVDCRSQGWMRTKLNLLLLSINQHLGEYRIHSEEMEMMVALTETSNHPMQFGLRAVR